MRGLLQLLFVGSLFLTACGGPTKLHWSDDAGRSYTEVTGSQEHCGWESVSFLYVGGTRYVRDPEEVLERSSTTMPYLSSTELPDDAIFTGYTEGQRELWSVAGIDAVFVVEGTNIERWPQIEAGCA
jgi:hypothetical protein